MLKLRSIEMEGFGPFAEREVIEFPNDHGVTVIYGENMRGKTTLLNAIRYAFFGNVLGRASQRRKLHHITNRQRAANGEFGFSVTLNFEYDGVNYELTRLCEPTCVVPSNDEHYRQERILRREGSVLGPQQAERELQHIFPREISRFFLFDGELLQEYEELLANESEIGYRISEAIEQILGVPILKRGRMHLRALAEDADRRADKEAQKHTETQEIGKALEQARNQRNAHRDERARLEEKLESLTEQKREADTALSRSKRYESLLYERDDIEKQLSAAKREIEEVESELKRAMAEAWRTVLRKPVRQAREAARKETSRQMEEFLAGLRKESVDARHCKVCEQEIGPDHARHLKSMMDAKEAPGAYGSDRISSMARLERLSHFYDENNVEQVRGLWKRLQQLKKEEIRLRDRHAELQLELSDSDPDWIRKNRASYSELTEEIFAVKQGIEAETQKIQQREEAIDRLSERLDHASAPDLAGTRVRAKMLHDAGDLFNAAIDEYKSLLRGRVESTATRLFRSMTTEKADYKGLRINENYGLAIEHQDGQTEEARSAGAEHVVALALMGALQNNAPLRGPIVMDSPFGRLDSGHTDNVIRALPEMAEQTVLLVYEEEVGKSRIREILGANLLKEFELERVTSRHTKIRDL